MILLVPSALAGQTSTPAQATVGGLMVSTDGVNFQEGRSLSMFEETTRVVPGDRLSDSVWVRNDSTKESRLRIDVTLPDSDSPDFAAGLTLEVTQHGSPLGPALIFNQSITNGDCTVLANEIPMPPGEIRRLDFTLSVTSKFKDRQATRARGHFSVRGVLEEITVPDISVAGGACVYKVGPEKPPLPRPLPPLALTGTGGVLLMLLLGTIAAGGGTILGVRAWRRHKAEGVAEQ